MNGRKNKLLICLLLVFIVVISQLVTGNKAASAEMQEIDIMTTPEKVLFDVDNMKPGDWSTRTLLITNSGKQDFSYLFSADLKSGSKKLYKELHLTVLKGEQELYRGSLGDFQKLEPRALASQGKEELVFTVLFPEHLGNEFQGLETEVEFKFYVEGTMGGTLPVDGPKLPDTATGMFNLIAAGAFLVLGGIAFFKYLEWKRREMKLT